MLGFVSEWRITKTHRDISEVAPGFIQEALWEDVNVMEEGSEGLRIERLIGRRGEQRTLAIRSISENHTRQEGKPRAQWTQPRVGDLVLVRDFERDRHHGPELDTRWIGPRILTKITSSEVSGFVRELYSEEVKKYHLDDLKIYYPRRECLVFPILGPYSLSKHLWFIFHRYQLRVRLLPPRLIGLQCHWPGFQGRERSPFTHCFDT